MDLLLLQQQQQHQRQQQQHHLQQHDLLSEPDTIDREVAATTANLALRSPTHSPYSKKKHHSKQKRNHSNTTTSTTSTTSMANKKTSDRALEKLQTEVTALTEQIDRLRSSIKLREERDRRKLNWSAWKIIKLLLKHLIANSVIFLIVFYVLWRKKSPLAYGILSYIMPIVQEIMRKVLRKVIFWKVAILK
ncbi:MAG: hypothetical protein EXX96DRAFT_476981 [Benjaminiella poitrasii]|nr:MAG: hypothetical protein EXX96DRAFT_476981 [Benjaminiella poitrasii]